MHQGKHVAVVATQQLAQMCAAGGMALIAFCLTDCTRSFEGLGDLLVQLHPIGHDHEGPVADQFA
ncbi:hypothetical protein D3C77_283300 [compost metagenome]